VAEGWPVTRKNFEARIRELVAGQATLERIAMGMLSARAALKAEYGRLHKAVLAIVRDDLLEAVQPRLDANPKAMRQRRETVEHPFGTMKARMGATHFLTKTNPKVAAEMAPSVLACNLTRVINIIGIRPLIAAIAA